MAEVRLPELGEGIENAKVSFCYIKEGDRVAQDDDLVELVTDKATFNVSATVPGVVKKILVIEGQEVKIGETLVIME